MRCTLKALVLLDIVNSTRFIERIGSARAAKVFFNHDKLVRTLIYRFGGKEIDKTDGFLILFDRCIDGVNFALAYHKTIPKRTTLQARIGIHWGEVVTKENEAVYVEQGAKKLEVEGLSKPIAARIMSLARGGQTLLSNEARRVSEHRTNAYTPQNISFKGLGKYKLKGVKVPMLVHAVGVKHSDFHLPEENDKVKKVARPPNAHKDWTLTDISLFFLKCYLVYLFLVGLWLMITLVWSDDTRDFVGHNFGLDLNWVKELKGFINNLYEAYEDLTKKI